MIFYRTSPREFLRGGFVAPSDSCQWNPRGLQATSISSSHSASPRILQGTFRIRSGCRLEEGTLNQVPQGMHSLASVCPEAHSSSLPYPQLDAEPASGAKKFPAERLLSLLVWPLRSVILQESMPAPQRRQWCRFRPVHLSHHYEQSPLCPLSASHLPFSFCRLLQGLRSGPKGLPQGLRSFRMKMGGRNRQNSVARRPHSNFHHCLFHHCSNYFSHHNFRCLNWSHHCSHVD